MPIDRLSWKEAILRALQESDEPLSCDAITRRIEEREYREITGATPNRTVSSNLTYLTKEGRVERNQEGLYATRGRSYEEDGAPDGTDASKAFSIKTCGLYWDRRKVHWAGRRELLGQQQIFANVVNFADQVGIYLLHSWNEIVYVGQTQGGRQRHGLYDRLKMHCDKKAYHWNAFSWFGFRPVNEDGTLGEGPAHCPFDDVVDTMETMLIEALMPRLNKQSGRGSEMLHDTGVYSQFARDVR